MSLSTGAKTKQKSQTSINSWVGLRVAKPHGIAKKLTSVGFRSSTQPTEQTIRCAALAPGQCCLEGESGSIPPPGNDRLFHLRDRANRGHLWIKGQKGDRFHVGSMGKEIDRLDAIERI